MKLTNRELDLLRSLDNRQRKKIIGLISVVIVLLLYWALRYFDVLRDVEISLDSLLIVYLAFNVGATFGNVTTDDRNVELLRRYVNNDAQAIADLAERKTSH